MRALVQLNVAFGFPDDTVLSIAADHLGDLGHPFGRNDQLRHNGRICNLGSARSLTANTSRRHEPMRSIRTSASQNASGVA
jgi:hypothetical protein